MEEDSIQKQLQFFFPKPTREDWKKIAVQETNGKDPFELLSWRGKDEINFLPYYDAQDAARNQHAGHHERPAANRWLNIPTITVSNEIQANSLALEQNTHGADGAFFNLNQQAFTDVGQLINGTQLQTHHFFFRLNDDEHFRKIFATARETQLLDQMNGVLFWESIPKTSGLSDHFKRCNNFRTLGIIVSQASPTEEIATALQKGVEVYERYHTSSPHHALRSISFSVSADASILETVAKIRALRQLWWQVAKAYGHDDYKLNDLHIHARSIAVSEGDYAPRQNMLEASFASIAAVAGGCSSLSIEGDDSAFFQRWASHVSNILREESFFDRMTDPLAGAYAVENITNAIALKAWAMFQSKVKTL